MTYNISGPSSKYLNSGLDIFKNASAESMATDKRVRFATHDTGNSHNSFVNTPGEVSAFSNNGYAISIPDDGHTYFLQAALDFETGGAALGDDYYRHRFYDTDQSKYIGFEGTRIRGYNMLFGTVGGVVADELGPPL